MRIRYNSSPGGDDELSTMKTPHFFTSNLSIPHSSTVTRTSSLPESSSTFQLILIIIKVVFDPVRLCLTNSERTGRESVATHNPTKQHIIFQFYCFFIQFKYFIEETVIFEYFLNETDMMDVVCSLEY